MPSALAHYWSLEPGLAFLNHGSFGATPRPVLEAQRAWQTRLEAEPVRFLARDLPLLLDEARGELATFIDADAEDLAFVPNATAGFNTVL
jgi:isopenicillin-N epimerase